MSEHDVPETAGRPGPRPRQRCSGVVATVIVIVIVPSMLLVGSAATVPPADLLQTGPTAVSTALPGLGPPVPGSASAGPGTPGTPGPSVTPEQSPVASGRPEPFVQSFAQQPAVEPQRPLPSPTATYSVAPNLDGCDHNYGTPNLCVPWTFPPGTTDKCAWLAAHGFEALPVVHTDRQDLDTNDDGIACGAGDG